MSEIQELRDQVAALQQRIEALEPKKIDRANASPTENEPRIIHLPPSSSFVAPSEEQLRRLHAAVLAYNPRLERTYFGKFADLNKADDYRCFCKAFKRIGFLRRTEALNSKRFAAGWIDEADEWLRLNDGGGRSGPGFLIAVIAHGDVRYSLYDHLGNVPEFGLSTSEGKHATDAWRKVLNGEILAPIPGKYGPARRPG